MSTEIDDGLTEEERAALADEDGGPNADPTNTEGSGETGEEVEQHEGDETGGEQGGDESGKTDEASETGAAAATEAGTQADNATPPVAQTAPLLVATAPENATERLEEIGTAKDELTRQWDDGEITAKEYQTQLDKLSKEERQLERALDKAQLAQEMQQQQAMNDWLGTVNRFIEANEVYKNPRLYRALDMEVRDIANDPANAGLTGQQVLDKAHANLAEAFGFAKEPAAKQGDKPADTAKQPKRPDAKLPPTLAKVPSAEINDTSGGKWSALDRMAEADPEGYEEQLFKMSQAERDAYLAGR